MARLTERVKANARSLRRASTDAEAQLWNHLRRHGLDGHKFRRQHPFGPYILDFYCAQTRLVVEVDRGQHGEAEYRLWNAARTRFLQERGLTVLRFTNREVLVETEAVLNAILAALASPSP